GSSKGRYLWIGMPEGCCGASPAGPTTGAAGSASAATGAGAAGLVIVESVIWGVLLAGDAGRRAARQPRQVPGGSGPVAAAKQEQRSTHADTVTPSASRLGAAHDANRRAQKPSRPSCLGSRCQSLATLIRRSRCTLRPSRALI